jgi:hypothetical protein
LARDGQPGSLETVDFERAMFTLTLQARHRESTVPFRDRPHATGP